MDYLKYVDSSSFLHKLDPRQILEFELTGLANGLDIRCERRGSLG